MKWIISTMQNNPKSAPHQDFNQELFYSLAMQFCNNLKYVGVLKQISNEHSDGGFSVSSMYFHPSRKLVISIARVAEGANRVLVAGPGGCCRGANGNDDSALTIKWWGVGGKKRNKS